MRLRQNILNDPERQSKCRMHEIEGYYPREKQQVELQHQRTASGAATGSSAASGAAEAVSGAAGELAGQAGGTTSGSVPGGAGGSTPVQARDSTVRVAEKLYDEDRQAHKFARVADDEDEVIAVLYGSTRLNKDGEVTDVAVTVPVEKNLLEYSNISPSDYYDLVDEDNGQPLDPQQVAEGVKREMKFLDEQRLGEPYPRSKVPGKAVIWTARWVHRVKGDGVRSRYVARQFKNASGEDDSEVYAATPRLESIRLLLAWALLHHYEVKTGDFSVAFMFTPVPDDMLLFVEAPAEAGLGVDKVWRLRKAMNGLRVSSRPFQDHLARILRAGRFEQSAAEKCLFIHREMRVVVTVHLDDPIVAGTSEGIAMLFKLVGKELKVRENTA
eukprot:1705375-Amphidinium_carterae.2